MSQNIDGNNGLSRQQSPKSSIKVHVGAADSTSMYPLAYDDLDGDNPSNPCNMESEYFEDEENSEEFSSDLDDEQMECEEMFQEMNPRYSEGFLLEPKAAFESERNHPAVSWAQSQQQNLKSHFKFTNEITCVPIAEKRQNHPVTQSTQFKSPVGLSLPKGISVTHSPVRTLDNNIPKTTCSIKSQITNSPVKPTQEKSINMSEAKSLTSQLIRRGLEIKPLYMNASSGTKVNTLPSNSRRVDGDLTLKRSVSLSPKGAVPNTVKASEPKANPSSDTSVIRKTVVLPRRNVLPNKETLMMPEKINEKIMLPQRRTVLLPKKETPVPEKDKEKMALPQQRNIVAKKVVVTPDKVDNKVMLFDDDRLLNSYDFDDCSDEMSFDSDDGDSNEMTEAEFSKALFQLDDISNSGSDEDADNAEHYSSPRIATVKNQQNMRVAPQAPPKTSPNPSTQKSGVLQSPKVHKNNPHPLVIQKMNLSRSNNIVCKTSTPASRSAVIVPKPMSETVKKCNQVNKTPSPSKSTQFHRPVSDSDSEYGDDDEDYDSEEFNELMKELMDEHDDENLAMTPKPGLVKKSNISVSSTGQASVETPTRTCNDSDVKTNQLASKEVSKGQTTLKDSDKNKENVSSDSCKKSPSPVVSVNNASLTSPRQCTDQSDKNADSNSSSKSCEKSDNSVPNVNSILARGLQKSSNVLNQTQKNVPTIKKVGTPKIPKNNKISPTCEKTNIINSIEKLKNEPSKENVKRIFKYSSVLNSNTIKRDDANDESGKGNDMTWSKLLSNNKNLTISIVQPATNTRQGGGPNKNNFNLQKNQLVNKFAKCPSCGAISLDLKVCDKCHQVISPASDLNCKSPANPSMAQPLSKRQFYGSKLKIHLTQNAPDGAASADKNFGENTPVRKVGNSKRAKAKRQEPVCLTLSSDEEGDGKSDSTHASSATPGPSDERNEPQSDDDNMSEHSTANKSRSECSSGRSSPQLEPTLIVSRSIRVGSYRIVDKHVVSVAGNVISFPFLTLNRSEEVMVCLRKKDLVNIKAHFGSSMPVLFITTTRSLGSSIRSLLEMPSPDGPYFDPESSDETQKRICIIPEKGISALQEVFNQFFGDILDVIDKNVANEILVLSTPQMQLTPKDPPVTQQQKNAGPETRSSGITVSCVEVPIKPKNPVFHMATYPKQPSTGRISITTEDYECLYPGEFLNDVIIDYYLKYLFLEKLSNGDRNRTHIFSSFFYGRLTTRPQSGNSTEDDPTLKPQQKRHARVKTWTRHVDIFSKDFIVIPVNEKSHWFLAIICFPGLVQATSAKRPLSDDDVTQSNLPSKQSKTSDDSQSKTSPQCQSNSTETPVGDSNVTGSETSRTELANSDETNDEISSESMKTCGDESNESKSDDLPSMNEDEAATPPVNKAINRKSSLDGDVCYKSPCILIFDSLIMPRGHTAIITILREYLTEEWAIKKRNEKVFNKDNMKGANLKVPQQDNYSDCGVYVLQYVESFFQTPIMNFKIPIVGLEEWFPEEQVKTKRQEIQVMIKRLASDQGTKYELREYVAPPEMKMDNVTTAMVIVKNEDAKVQVTSSTEESCEDAKAAAGEG